jgi:hypothetical protein
MFIQYLAATKVLQVCPCKYTIGAYVTPSMATINYKPREKNERIVIRVAICNGSEACTPFIYLLCLGIGNTRRYSHTLYII